MKSHLAMVEAGALVVTGIAALPVFPPKPTAQLHDKSFSFFWHTPLKQHGFIRQAFSLEYVRIIYLLNQLCSDMRRYSYLMFHISHSNNPDMT